MQEPKKFSIRRIVGIFLVGFGILISVGARRPQPKGRG